MYNATNAATWLNSPPCIALRCAAIQRNNLFVNLSLHLDDAQRIAANCDLALLISTQLNDLFVTPRRNVAYSIAALFNSTRRFVYFFSRLNSQPLGSQRRGTPHRNSTICLSIYCRSAAIRFATQPFTAQLNDLFVTSRLHATSLNPTPRDSPQRLTLLLHVVLGKATQRTET